MCLTFKGNHADPHIKKGIKDRRLFRIALWVPFTIIIMFIYWIIFKFRHFLRNLEDRYDDYAIKQSAIESICNSETTLNIDFDELLAIKNLRI